MKLNKNKVYDLSELTSEELKEVAKETGYLKGWNEFVKDSKVYLLYFQYQDNDWVLNYAGIDLKYTKINSKELFYTLENIQVDCSNINIIEYNNIVSVYIENEYDFEDFKEEGFVYLSLKNGMLVFRTLDEDKITITYDKFMELFADELGQKTTSLFKDLTLTPVYLDNIRIYGEYNSSITEGSDENTSFLVEKLLNKYQYSNTNGSIYKFCNDQKLNAWEFDIIKRIVRCRKKGLFKEGLQKTKDLIDLYLKEFEDEK